MRRQWIVVALLPLAAYALLLLITVAQLQRDTLRGHLERELDDASDAMQRVLSQEIAYLSGVAASKTLDAGDLDGFRTAVELAWTTRPFVHTIILNDTRRQVLNLRAPPGKPLPPLQDPESLEAVWMTGKPVIGNLKNGKIALRVPILRDGEIRYVLSEIVNHQMFNELLRSKHTARGWIATLIDSRMTILARSERAEEFVGTAPMAAVAEAIRRGETGLTRRVTKEGIDAYGAVIPLGETGWFLSMAIPDIVAEESDRPLRWLLIGGGGMALLVVVLLALFIVWSTVGKLQSRTDALSTDLAQANRRSKDMADFLAMMSHELRTPLTGILGFSEMLVASRLDRQQREWVNLQCIAGRTLMSIINDILDYSKIEAGCVRLETVDFDVRDLIGQCITLIAPAANAKSLSVALDVQPDAPHWLHGDPIRLQQVIGNLLNNAVKFTEYGEVRLAVMQSSAGGCGSLLRVAVHDTGIGIPPDKHDRLFRRFSQADSSTTREYGGTGLGLAVCKSLIELMGGRIGFDSVEGAGSTFWFSVSLPLAAERVAGPAAADPASGADRATARILLVEDNPINQTLSRTILERAGHSVAVADNGADAVEAVRREPFDLVLMDVHMPVLDGVGATRAIRALEGERGQVPILALTADAFHEGIAVCLAAGMDGHLAKPFLPDALLSSVNDTLRQGRAADPVPFPVPFPAPPPTPAPPEDAGEAETDPEMRDAMVSVIGEAKLAMLQDAFREHAEATRLELVEVRGDHAALHEACHPLIGGAGMLGYLRIVEAARALCQACKAGDDDRVAERFSDLMAALDTVRAAPRVDSVGD